MNKTNKYNLQITLQPTTHPSYPHLYATDPAGHNDPFLNEGTSPPFQSVGPIYIEYPIAQLRHKKLCKSIVPAEYI